jgi:hypothetical protein
MTHLMYNCRNPVTHELRSQTISSKEAQKEQPLLAPFQKVLDQLHAGIPKSKTFYRASKRQIATKKNQPQKSLLKDLYSPAKGTMSSCFLLNHVDPNRDSMASLTKHNLQQNNPHSNPKIIPKPQPSQLLSINQTK